VLVIAEGAKMKRFFSTLISTALMLSAISFTQTTFGAEASRGSSFVQRRKAAVRFVTRQIKESNAKLRYTITAKYPQSITAKDPRLERLNYAIKSLIKEQVAAFKKNFEAPEERMDTVGSYFDTEYSGELATNDLVSIHFYIDTYYEGAAHPNHFALTFNYSFETDKTLTLAELFKANSNYLKVISDYSIKALRKELGDNADSDWIQNGAGADEKNYRNWNITRRGLEINFDPYQVASYMEGPHEVVIPYRALRNLIDLAGPLAKIVK
jgi:hypothetical protein